MPSAAMSDSRALLPSVRNRIGPARVLEYWLPLALWLGVILLFSTDTFRAGATGGIIVPLLRAILGLTLEQAEYWHAVIRKAGHVSEYAILAFLAFRAIAFESWRLSRTIVLSGVFVLLVAVTDEWHQLMTDFRSGSAIDVAYDCFGGLVVLAVLSIRRN